MSNSSKIMKINANVLMEWTFDSENNISENYKVITNLNEKKKRSFLSNSTTNNIDNNLFLLDSVLRKYTNINTSKYNFLQYQDYNTAPIPYDKVKLYLPTNYNFVTNGYVGLYIKIYTYDYYNEKVFELSNIFFDSTSSVSGIAQLSTPFIYDEQEWGKYYEFQIPSIDYVSNQRSISITGNTVWNNTINDDLTLGVGLSQTSPIFVDFQYLVSKEIVLGTTYYYSSESYRTSFPKAAEYSTLAVNINESTEGDFFEIFGTYDGSTENLDNFIREQENKGRRIRIEYDIYLYEENIQTNMQTVVVAGGGPNDDFTKKILYRPILTFSNTTAFIKVIMRVIDLVDISTIERTATLGLSSNIQKYGKKLISLNIQNINKLKIYNAKPDEIVLGNDYLSGNITTEIVKVNSPQLIEVGKIIVNSSASSSTNSEYKSMGLLNIVITPFDNIIQFRLASLTSTSKSTNQLEIYNLSNILNNAELVLIFKSDTEIIEKTIYKESNNDYVNGIVNFKIIENDIKVLKSIYSKGFTNFYLTLVANNQSATSTIQVMGKDKVRTLLYSGTYTLFENITFVDNNINYVSDLSDSIPISSTTNNISTDNTTISEPEWPKAGRTVIIYTKYKDTSSTSN